MPYRKFQAVDHLHGLLLQIELERAGHVTLEGDAGCEEGLEAHHAAPHLVEHDADQGRNVGVASQPRLEIRDQ